MILVNTPYLDPCGAGGSVGIKKVYGTMCYTILTTVRLRIHAASFAILTMIATIKLLGGTRMRVSAYTDSHYQKNPLHPLHDIPHKFY